jgi:hypothetical protein
MGSVEALDKLAKGFNKYAGSATFDAAYVLELTPRRDDASFWEDLGSRYDAAAKRLKDQQQKQRASDYAGAARATAAALAPKP